MPFNPEAPRTEDREFHPDQEKLNQISQELAKMLEKDQEEPDNEYWQDAYEGSLEVLEDQIRQLRERVG